MATPLSDYRYANTEHCHAHAYLLPTISKLLPATPCRVFELGCGNGAFAGWLAERGFDVVGVDPSTDGIALARQSFPQCDLRVGSSDDNLAATFGAFPVVTSLEVVEHVYSPKRYSAALFDLVEPGGMAIISTPYHGYAKNVALAVSGKLDSHFTALWEGGHIKFWSRATLSRLLTEAGFASVEFHHVGRVPMFAKSMVAVARRS
jgi:2-polyprenyl-3-methyl-5-hydroxy-6-metoxy-1,4-benzoquinol methylase